MTNMTDTKDTSDVRDFRTRISASGHPSGVSPLTITNGRRHTLAIETLRPTAEIIVSADRIGFHVEPATEGGERSDYLTVAPVVGGSPVILLEIGAGFGPRVLDLIEQAIADDLTGELTLQLAYYTNVAGYAWHVTGGHYTDAEGNR